MFEDRDRALVGAALDALVPGAAELGAVDYVERLLTALDHEPPRLWAAPGAWAGPGPAWLEVGPWERHAWRGRIVEWRDVYRRVIAGEATADDERVLYAHACEATYGDPAYGGNRDGAGWARIGFPPPQYPPRREGG